MHIEQGTDTASVCTVVDIVRGIISLAFRRNLPSGESCCNSSILSYIGWMFLSESCTSSVVWCSTACTVRCLRTSWNCANQSQVSRCGNIFDPPPDSSGRRAFCVAGPSIWYSQPDSLQDPVIGRNSFGQSLKTFLFATYWCIQHIRGFTTMHYINQLFTYKGGRNVT